MTEIEQLQKEHQDLAKRIQALKDRESQPKGFEVGKWYVNNEYPELLFNYQGDKNHYGFGAFGLWTNNYIIYSDGYPICQHYHKATEQEVKDALVKEAEKRGFKEGVKCTRIQDFGDIKLGVHREVIPYNNKFEYLPKGLYCLGVNLDQDVLTLSGNSIYAKGVWATIVKDEPIRIGGYDVKFPTSLIGYCTIDGHHFKEDFWQAAKLISEHSKAKVMIGCSKQLDVSLETINKILDKLK